MNLFQSQVQKNRPLWGDRVVLSLDPGETTGACKFVGNAPAWIEQIPTGLIPQMAVSLCDLILTNKPDVLVVEDYRVYKWKTDSHAWAGLHTPRLIGMIEFFAFTQGIPLVKQSAQVGKGFCTDERLKEWGFYKPGKRHAVDAVRHACQFLMFGDATWPIKA